MVDLRPKDLSGVARHVGYKAGISRRTVCEMTRSTMWHTPSAKLGGGGMSARDKLEARARNLFVVTGGTAVALFAGFQPSQATLPWFRTVSQYPQVIVAALVVALIWFWWRYHVAWLDSDARSALRREYLSILHSNLAFKNLALRELTENFPDEIDEVAHRIAEDHGGTTASNLTLTDVTLDANARFVVQASTLTFHNPEGNKFFESKYQQFSDLRLRVRVPTLFHYRRAIKVYWWWALRKESFATMVLPQLAFAVSLTTLTAAIFGINPAGMYGLIEPTAGSLAASAEIDQSPERGPTGHTYLRCTTHEASDGIRPYTGYVLYDGATLYASRGSGTESWIALETTPGAAVLSGRGDIVWSRGEDTGNGRAKPGYVSAELQIDRFSLEVTVLGAFRDGPFPGFPVYGEGRCEIVDQTLM